MQVLHTTAVPVRAGSPTPEEIERLSLPTPPPENPPVRADMVPYGTISALRGAELVRAAGKLAMDGQVAHRYSEASDELFRNVDDVTGEDGVLDAYTGVVHAGVHDRATAWPSKLSVEHTWPRAHGAREWAESDLHHLRATDKTANGRRGNHPHGEVVGPTQYETSPGTPWRSELGHDASGRTVFDPPERVRGDIARGLFYFAARYGTGLPGAGEVSSTSFLDSLPTLLAWHEQDPVTDDERARNDRVALFQGNRNPFVDHPEFVTGAGEAGFREALGPGAQQLARRDH